LNRNSWVCDGKARGNVKHIAEFDRFLKDEVNLNQSRINLLTDRVDAVQTFLQNSDWKPVIRRFAAQGSWAHKTIIKPPGDGGFDADLLVFVDHIPGWEAKNYVLTLRDAFLDSGIYKDKVSLNNRCVLIEYVGDFQIDVVPCVERRPGGISVYEVCNRTDNLF